ncbi:hypothetical protein ABT390_36550 [Streptomyces aurantiacus]|uniref:Uncharacterized protein n=1 Tax=Streptomyces aurantiacus JA 4570 TaxID=1286094 RepID=S4AH75_9ACTN|nr:MULTISPECIES: hypothetical protein [Streptomyces]EPH40847.1 hypothetical protein STRAU_6062 [Streptomyces aurantiacus JA 4570]
MLDVLGDHPESVEADLIRYFGGDPLAAYWRGEITLRKLRVLVEALPPDSATARAEAGHHWTHLDYAAADTRDLVELLLTAFINANRDPKAAALRWPEPSWRPGDALPEDTSADEEAKRAKARAAYEHIVARATGG